MKALIQFVIPTIKAAIIVAAFLIGLGFSAYGIIIAMVKAEGQDIKNQVMNVREVDMEHINHRFDRVDKRIEQGFQSLQKSVREEK